MGAVGLSPPARAPFRPAPQSLRAEALGLRLLAFTTLALLAGMRFAALLLHPPTPRVLAVVALATACGAVLATIPRTASRRGVATAARVGVLALTAYLALRAAGASPRILWPWHWGALGDRLDRGMGMLDGLWPYRGSSPDARTTMMIALATTMLAATALAFWPTERERPRARIAALCLLLLPYLVATANEPRAGWQVQGMLLLGLLCLWARASMRPAPALEARMVWWVLACAVLALLGGGIGARWRPLLDYRAWNPFEPAAKTESFDWNQTYGPLPWSQSSETMVEVATARPDLLRATTLDRFDGVRFLRSAAQPPVVPGSDGSVANRRWLTRATVTVRGLAAPQLLSPGETIALSLAGASLPRLEPIAPDGSVLSAGPDLRSATRYTVTAYAPRPTPAQLRSAPAAFPAAYLPYTRLSVPVAPRGTVEVSPADAAGAARIEASPYARVYALARDLDAGAADSYEVVERIEAFLHRGFTYDTTPPRRTYPLATFLLRDRVGYCQQFSGAMTLLLRMDGIPARVAAGFLPGARNAATGLYAVSAREAHAWVEVYFAGIGWVPFDPTPPEPALGSPIPAPTGVGPSAAGAAGEPVPVGHRRSEPAALAPAIVERHASSAGLDIALVGVLALLVLAGVGVGVARRGGGRTSSEDADRELHDLQRALARAGAPAPPGMTLAQLERSLCSSHGEGAGRYVRLLRRRRYAPAPNPRSPSARDRRALRRALSAGRGPLLRFRLLLALAPWRHAAIRRRRALEG
jgi:transglutaminase-like putative cysteine protease